MLLGVDVGGTFTDAVLYDGRRLHTAKAPTTPADQSRGVIAAIDAVLERAAATATDVEVFAHGMTVGTNALLEERGARTALVATQGFADLLEIGRQNRPRLYHLCTPKPAPLAPPELSFGVPERVGPDGVIEPLSDESVAELVEAVRDSGAEAVAVCLLFSYLEPAHETALAERIREALPRVHVSASHEVLPQFREYERCSTTVIDAYLSPLLDRYLGRLAEAAGDRGLPEPLVMQSSGGVAPAAEAARAGAWSVLSGPAGGAVGAGLLARVSGDGDALGFDMGGTSCDVCVVEGWAAEAAVARLGSTLDLAPLETAEGIVRVANQEMVRALRVVTVERGVDPRGYALMPFGGAGPMHAAAVADELEVERILCPRASGVLSALGLIASDRRRDTARTVMLRGAELTAERIAEALEELRGSLGAGLEGAAAEATFEMRYRGQAFELPVPGALRPDPSELAEGFAAEH